MAKHRDQMRHRQQKNRQRERPANPEAARHVSQFRILFFDSGDSFRLQGHAALRAISRMILLNFRVHRAGVNRFACCWRDPCRISFQGHAAFWAGARFIGFHAGTHRAKVVGVRRWLRRHGAVPVVVPVHPLPGCVIQHEISHFILRASCLRSTGRFFPGPRRDTGVPVPAASCG